MSGYSGFGMHFAYEDLKNPNTCSLIYEYCTGQKFNHDRWKLLDKLDISIFVDRKIEEVHNNMNEAITLFKGAA